MNELLARYTDTVGNLLFNRYDPTVDREMLYSVCFPDDKPTLSIILNWCNQYGGTTCVTGDGGQWGKNKHLYTDGGNPRGRIKGGGNGRAGGSDAGTPARSGGGVADKAGRSGDGTPGRKGVGKGKSPRAETPEDTTTREISEKLDRYKNVFAKKGHPEAAEWMDLLKEHIQTVGAEHAKAALGEAKAGSQGAKKVQYEGAYDELGETQKEGDFIKSYLSKAGVSLIHQDSKIDASTPYVSSFSQKNLQQLGRDRSNVPGYVPTDQNFANKLQESKALPGLESSEDVHKVMGEKVTHFTPEVIAKFDKQYGKGSWIVKSYGDEAYAGFGIFFPQRVKQIQADAKASMMDARSKLKGTGYKIARDESANATGLTGPDGKHVAFGTPEFEGLSKKVQTIGRQVQQASHAEHGARLPVSPEDAIKNDYGISFRRDDKGIPIGITDRDGKKHDFDSPAMKHIEDMDGGAAGHAIHRAQEADEWRRQGFQTDPKFMVQPAFKAVGVSDYDRAMGATWETAKEGRVHVTTDPKTGKASAVPYATLVGRGDDLPAVFASKDSKEMEAAVEHAINRLPASERNGQMYAPDVMKTKDGWKVIELNPSAAGGGSDWLGRNPFVIDAVSSHLTGKEPMHVQFIRDLLRGKIAKAEEKPQPHEEPHVEVAKGTTKPGVKGG